MNFKSGFKDDEISVSENKSRKSSSSFNDYNDYKMDKFERRRYRIFSTNINFFIKLMNFF